MIGHLDVYDARGDTAPSVDVSLTHDLAPGVYTAKTVNGHAILGPFDWPTGNGATLTFNGVVYHGVLWLNPIVLNPVNGSASLAIDRFPFKRASDLQRLTVRGRYFQQADGTHWTAKQVTDFALFGRYVREGEAAVRPVIAERSGLGFNLHRTFTFYDVVAAGAPFILQQHADLYDRLPAFCRLCAEYGMTVQFVAYSGILDRTGQHNIFDPGDTTRRTPALVQHWTRLGQVLTGQPNVILELVNENDQGANAIDTSLFQPIPGILCSRGSNGTMALPVRPAWDWEAAHSNGAFEWWNKARGTPWFVSRLPLLMNENTRCPDRDNNPENFYAAGAGAALRCAGVDFHSVSGSASQLFTPTERSCAQAMIAGCLSVDLSHQDDPVFTGDYHAYFNQLVAGKPFGQATLESIVPQLLAVGVALGEPNAEKGRTKLLFPGGAVVRVGFGEGYWVWILDTSRGGYTL